MGNLISFVNAFLSYFVLMVIILVVGGIAIAIGLTLAKKKNAKAAVEAAGVETVAEESEKA